jgi:imidazolonepropionase-like amidohydrolase
MPTPWQHWALGAEFLYGAEIAHQDIPWGIDAQELIYMMHAANMQPIDVLRSATSKAGKHLSLPLLGTLQRSAPADIIAVKGDPTHSPKILEYPDLVMSGGKIVVNNFEN